MVTMHNPEHAPEETVEKNYLQGIPQQNPEQDMRQASQLDPSAGRSATVITIRALSGLSGDMLLTGFALMRDYGQKELGEFIEAIGLPVPKNSVKLEQRAVNGVTGWGCAITLPHEHAHRKLADIQRIIQQSAMQAQAKALAIDTFSLLAEVEGKIHGLPAADVTFHEVGALDSLLDICVVCSLFVDLLLPRIVCSPLPLADGYIFCAHGWLPSPAPAVLAMLPGVPVTSFAGSGETVTPTALALLKVLGIEFGPWPDMTIEKTGLVYGSKIFAGAANGAIWARGHYV